MNKQNIILERNEQLFANWIIKEEDLKYSPLKHKKLIGYFILKSSSSFESRMYPGLKYLPQLMISDDRNGRIYFRLFSITNCIKNIEQNFDIQVKSAKSSASLMCHYDDSYLFLLCNKNELETKNYIVDNEFVIDMIVNIKKGVLNLPKIIFKPLNVRNEEEDFVFDVKGKNEVKVHKKVLCQYSTVFTVMFESNWKESIENRMKIRDFSFEVVDAAIEFLYTGYCNINFGTENIIQLLYFADKYDIDQLKMHAENCLIPTISFSNVYEFTNLSIMTNALELRKHCIAWLRYCSVNDLDFKRNATQLCPEIHAEINE